MTRTVTYAAVSDLHGHLPDPITIPEADFLFIVGDFCPARDHSLGFQYRWCKGTFGPWMQSILDLGRVKHIVGVCGNHDFLGEAPYGKVVLNDLPWTYLQDQTVVIEGVKIHGSPWTPQFYDWAFMERDWELMQYWNQIPATGLDVLLTHGPQKGVLDRPIFASEGVGSESLAARLEQIDPPQVHLVGHIHSARGVHGGIGPVPLSANVAYVNEDYNPEYGVFEGELIVKGDE